MKKFTASYNDHNRTLFKFLVNVLNNVPISRIQRLLREKDVKVNGVRVNDRQYSVQVNDEIEVYGVHDIKEEKVLPKIQIKFEVNYEDANILVVEKPANVEMHGGLNCLDNQVNEYLNFVQTDSFKVSHISRLDKATSGLVIYAKNYRALVELTSHVGDFEKTYQFVSNLKESQTTQFKILYNPIIQRMEEDPAGSLAITEFIVRANKKYAILKTGKKHQIRISLALLGCPILGDVKYGGKPAKRLYLHCRQIILNNLGDSLSYLNGKKFKSIKELDTAPEEIVRKKLR